MTQEKRNAFRIALCALAVLGAATASQAADVKIYGQANVSLYYQDAKSGDASLSMQNEASRFGITAKEALTDETDVLVYLETGYGLDDGTFTNNGKNNVGTTLFDRRSILAVRNARWGELAFGRMGTVRSSMAPYGYGLGMLDPFGTNYGPDGSISGMFGNDTRGNNTITYMSPKLAGFSAGMSYSLSAYDNEEAQSSKNDRQLSGLVNYSNGPLYAVAAATEQRFGDNRTGGSDAGYGYERKNARAYTAGITYEVNPDWKLFFAAQYHENWRNVAAWNIDSYFKGDAAELRHGIDGTTALAGFTWRIAGPWRLLADYMYFDGEHKTADGSELEARRHIVNGALEYWFSKNTRVFATASWSTADGALESDTLAKKKQTDVNRVTGRIGMAHYF